MTPAGFAMYSSRGIWKPARHLNLINRLLMEVASGRRRRLILTIPPRHGKTELSSIRFPVWFLGTYPDKEVIFITHTATFAEENIGTPTRALFREFGPEVFGKELSDEKATTGFWKVKGHKGSFKVIGVGGEIMGRGADLLIVDDPLKNEEEANSTTVKEKLFAWWGSTAYSRLNPGGSCIIIHQRWAVDDLVGRLLEAEKKGGEKWDIVNLPAIAIEDEPEFPLGMGRKKGEALWPERWPVEELLRKKNSGAMTVEQWESLYQQNPIISGGGVFKKIWFRYYTASGDWILLENDRGTEYVDSNRCWKFITCDTANKPKKTSDYSVIATWLVTPKKDLLLWDLERDRMGYEEVIKKIKLKVREHDPVYVGIENMGTAIQMINELRNMGLPVKALEPQGKGKQNRANAPLGAVVRMESGKVYFPKYAQYMDEIELELLSFPKGKQDDFCDVFSYAANELTKVDYAEDGDFAPYEIEGPLGIKKASNHLPDFPIGL